MDWVRVQSQVCWGFQDLGSDSNKPVTPRPLRTPWTDCLASVFDPQLWFWINFYTNGSLLMKAFFFRGVWATIFWNIDFCQHPRRADGTTGLAGTIPCSLRNYSETLLHPTQEIDEQSGVFWGWMILILNKREDWVFYGHHISQATTYFLCPERWWATEDQPVLAVSLCIFTLNGERHISPTLGVLKTRGWLPCMPTLIKSEILFLFMRHSSLMNNIIVVMV